MLQSGVALRGGEAFRVLLLTVAIAVGRGGRASLAIRASPSRWLAATARVGS